MYYALLLALLFPAIVSAQSCSIDSFTDSIKSFISSRVDSRFTANETRLATCESNHSSHFSSINLLSVDLTAAKSDLLLLRTGLTDAENIISDHETRLTTLETLMSSIPTTAAATDATQKSITQTAHGFTVGQWVYLSAASTYALADADLAASSESVGVVTSVADANTFTLTTEGYASGLTGLTAATRYYISATAGDITATAPSSNIKAVFIADTTTSGWVQQYAVGASSQALTYGRVNASADLPNTAFSITSPGTKIPFNATVYSSGTTFSGTDSIIPSVAGRYRADFFAQAGSGQFNGNGTFHIVQGGVSLGSVYVDMMEAAGVNQTTPTIDVALAAGTAVELRFQPDVADSIIWQRGSYFQLTQLPTAVAPVVNTVAEYGENNGITHNGTLALTGTTVIDVPGSSFTLPSAGVWEVDYNLFTTTSTAGQNYGFFIRDSSNNIVANSSSEYYNSTGSSGTSLNISVGNKVFITTTGSATYKLSGIGGSGAFTVTVYNAVASNAQQSGNSKITWNKIAGQLPVNYNWGTYTPTITAVTTNPTKPTSGIVIDTARYIVEGKKLTVNYTFWIGTAVAPGAGSGTYKFSLPAGYTIDTTAVTTISSVDATLASPNIANVVGNAILNRGSQAGLNSRLPGYVYAADANTVTASFVNNTIGTNNMYDSAAGNAALQSGIGWTMQFTVPIN